MIPRYARVAAVLIAVVVGAAGYPGQAAAEDSSAVAVNTKDGKSVFRLTFHVKRTMDSDVDNDNAAVAYASCESCRTVAASIQVVLVMGEAELVTTDNVAVAINYECSECETLAAAYQYVYGEGSPVRFTAEGNRKLAELRRRLQELRRRDDLTLEQLAQEIAQIAAEVAAVVDEELVPAGQEGAPGEQTTTTEATTTSTTATDDLTGSEDGSTTTTSGDGTGAEDGSTTTTSAG
jgi:putative peptide zinc metalloprotease protein